MRSFALFVAVAGCAVPPPGDPPEHDSCTPTPSKGAVSIDPPQGIHPSTHLALGVAELDVIASWTDACTDPCNDSCTAPGAALTVTTTDPRTRISPSTMVGGDDSSASGLIETATVYPATAGLLSISATSTSSDGQTVSTTAEVHMHALDALTLCATAGTNPPGSWEPCVTSFATGEPFGIVIWGDYEGFVLPIAPTLTWIGLGSTPAPTCVVVSGPSANDSVPPVGLYCPFQKGVTGLINLHATQATVEGAITIQVRPS